MRDVVSVQVMADPRIRDVSRWWTAERFDMAIRLVQATRKRKRVGDETLERIALQMSSDVWAVGRYRSGIRRPGPKSLWFIDKFFSTELGELWTKAVDHELDEAGKSQSRAPLRSAEGVF